MATIRAITAIVTSWVDGALTMTAAAHERAKKRRELWLALTDFIQSHGGWVVSPPSGRYLRIEVPQGSSLPVRLAKVGYGLRHAGMTTRIGDGFVTVDVLELDLSGK